MTTQVFVGEKAFFPFIDKVQYEGADSDNPLAFKV